MTDFPRYAAYRFDADPTVVAVELPSAAASPPAVPPAVPPGGYVLPPATPTTLGGVKAGTGLAVASDGTLSAAGVAAGVASLAGLTGAVTLTQLGAAWTVPGLSSAGPADGADGVLMAGPGAGGAYYTPAADLGLYCAEFGRPLSSPFNASPGSVPLLDRTTSWYLGRRVVGATVLVRTAFNGTAPAFSLGTTGAGSADLIAPGEADLTAAGLYCFELDFRFAGTGQVVARTVTGTGMTAGDAVLTIYLA